MRRVRSQVLGPVFGLVVVSLVVGCVLPVGASAAPKALLSSFGSPSGPLGGQLVLPRGLAANQSGAGGVPEGSVYVAEGNANHRISQFTANGEFVRAWGFDVVGGNAETGFEVCTVAAQCKAGVAGVGAGQLNNPGGMAVDQDTGFVYVTNQTNRRVDVFSATGQFAGAFGWGVDTGIAALEVCTTASVCQAAAAAGAAGGNFQGLTVSAPSIDPNEPGSLYVPDVGNARVSLFETTITGGVLAEVQFVKAFGWDVVASGPGDDTTDPVNELENCVPANGDVCKQGLGTPGGGSGQFGPVNTGSPTVSAVDSTGAVYVTSGPMVNGNCTATNPCRIQKFAPDTNSATDFGPSDGPGQIRFESGASTAVAALAIAIDPSNDHVYVLRRESTTTYKVLEFDSDGNYVETHPGGGTALTGSNVNLGPALAAGVGGRVNAVIGGPTSSQVNILGPVPDAAPAMVSVSDVEGTTAKFNGTVEIPEPGAPVFSTSYRFEYSSNGVDWTRVPAADASVGDGATGAHNVTQTVTGLSPNTLYSVRLVATTGGSVTSSPSVFSTETVAPRVASTFADEVEKAEARLGAHVDPEGLPTTYRFEWGDQPCSSGPDVCAKAPGFERGIGDSNKVVVVNEPIGGLSKATRYHYRVVATNAKGVTYGPDQSFETLNDCNLINGRCYELISPADKGVLGSGGGIVSLGKEMGFQAAPDRPAIAYTYAYGAPDAVAGEETIYRAERDDDDGWESTQMSPPAVVADNSLGGSSIPSRLHGGFSAGLECAVFASVQPLGDAPPMDALEMGAAVLYRRGVAGDWAVATPFAPVPGPFTPSELPGYDFRVAGMAQEPWGCDRVVFTSPYKYAAVPHADPGGPFTGAYEWANGTLSWLGVVPGPDGLGCSDGVCLVKAIPGSLRISESTIETYNAWNAVSDDGRRVYFSALSKVGDDVGKWAVFLREDGAVGVDVSRSQTVSPPLAGGAANDDDSVYQTASVDGSVVFFTARYGLASNADGSAVQSSTGGPGACQADGAGCDLYRYSVDTGKLTDVSAHPHGAGAGVVGVLGASDDGEHVYFAARGQLEAGKGRTEVENLAADTYSVYHAQAGGPVRYVGRIREGQDEQTAFLAGRAGNGNTGSTFGVWSSRVTPDGGHLLFASRESLTDYPSAGQPQAYLYDADAGSTVCVSCRRDLGPRSVIPIDPAVGRDSLFNSRALVEGGMIQNQSSPPLTVTDDGRRVFFISPDRLAVGGVDGRENLYQWEEGQITFLAASEWGLGVGLRFAGASRTGDDVYFATADRYSWEDVDGKHDVYDARVGGGFDPPAGGELPCDPVAGSCSGPGAGESDRPALETDRAGSGNASPGVRARFSVHSVSRAQRIALATGRRVMVSVDVNRPGRVSVQATTTLGGLSAVVLRGSREAKAAGRVRIPVRLSAAARRWIVRRGRLGVVLRVRFAGAAKPAARRLVLQQSQTGKRNANSDRRTGK